MICREISEFGMSAAITTELCDMRVFRAPVLQLSHPFNQNGPVKSQGIIGADRK
jgi:hypothetical protein